jgi:ubiquinone/menaquinone biosynthesis C-methylase UbiE
MKFVRFRQRSNRLENLDTGSYTAEEYEGCIKELQLVNKWLGDARVLRQSLLREIEDSGLQSASILDVGAGSGELLRIAAQWFRQTNRMFSATGLELNARSAYATKEESVEFPEIKSVRGDALQLPFRDGAFDYVISSLFTHHFGDDQVVTILKEMKRVAARGIYVIDLHRHPIAYFLYTTVGKLLLHNRLLREDGALSILRSFKSTELIEVGERAGLENVCVQRHFPFRLVLSARVSRLHDFSVSSNKQSDKAA